MPTSLRHKRVACQRLERHGPCCPARSRMDSGRVAGVGFLLPGDVWYDLIDGLPVSFRQLGLEERKQFIPVIRDWNFKASIAKPVRTPFVRVQSVIYLHPVTEKCGAERPGSFARTNVRRKAGYWRRQRNSLCAKSQSRISRGVMTARENRLLRRPSDR